MKTITKKKTLDVDFVKSIFLQFAPKNVFNKDRKRHLVYYRHVYMELCKTYTNASWSQIGKSAGGRDHATAMHGCKEFKYHSTKNYFYPYLEIYRKVSNTLESNSNQISKILNEETTYKNKLFNYILLSSELRKKLQNKINNLSKSSVIEDVAELPEEKFKEFEHRTMAFLKMNT